MPHKIRAAKTSLEVEGTKIKDRPPFRKKIFVIYLVLGLILIGAIGTAFLINEKQTVNRVPIAKAGSNQIAFVGETIHLNGAGIDYDGTIVMYEWDFDGDGIYDWIGIADGITTHIYETAGIYYPTLRVTDNNNTSGLDSCTISVTINQSPIARAVVKYDKIVSVNELVTFDGSGSYDPDGTIIAYEWDFGDEHTSDGMTTTHTYSSGGTYTIILTVTDEENRTNVNNCTVAVIQSYINRNFVKVIVDYSGHWSGTRTWRWDTMESVESQGRGTWYGNLTDGEYVGATIGKIDDGYGELRVTIMVGGVVVKTASTTAAYGLVSISWIVE